MGELTEEIVSSRGDFERLLALGEGINFDLGNRHIGETKMNEKSSRSHTIFRIVLALM